MINLHFVDNTDSLIAFQRKKEDIKSTSIQTRSKAHDIIKRMLSSLGDPYTRFLSPDQVISVHFLLSLLTFLFYLFSEFVVEDYLCLFIVIIDSLDFMNQLS